VTRRSAIFRRIGGTITWRVTLFGIVQKANLERDFVQETNVEQFPLNPTGVPMNKIMFASALALTLAASGTAFAQPASDAANPAPPVAAKPRKAEKSPLTIEKLTQDLQKAGFSDVKVLEDAFLVQAKTKDGNPILMTFGPNGMSALEV
jgi:hypothetical protein